MRRFAWLCVLSGLGVSPALAASPWDGDWEGQLRHQDLPCNPCKVIVSVRDGVGTVSGTVEITGLRIEADGTVVAVMRRTAGPGTGTMCSLRGRIRQDKLDAAGACGSDAELQLTRRSGAAPSTATLQPPVPPGNSGGPVLSVPVPTPNTAPAPPPAVPIAPVAGPNFGAGTQPLRLSAMEYGMPQGTKLGEFQTGSWATSCGAGARRPITHSGQREVADISNFRRDFGAVMQRSGYSIEQGSIGGGYVIIGTITSMDITVCIREGSQPLQVSGSGRVTVAWRVMAPLGDTVLYRATTSGAKDVPSSSRSADGLQVIVGETFSDAANRLAADPGFRDAVARPIAAAGQQRITQNSDISTVRGPRAFQGPITPHMDQVLAATVVITAGGSLGSGFIIDASGLILTNHHVVRSADVVTVRFSNGERTQGLVIRSDRDRDVALVRVQKPGLKALPIRTSKPVLTEQVFAVGAPQGLDQTVTRGIVSAMRALGGSDWIQSDAAVAPGSSGGPLLDASGNVIGISTLASARAAGFNLFVPIQDALARLGLTLLP